MPIQEQPSTLLTIAAILPSLFLIYKVYQWDKTEKEPKGLLLSLFILGALSILPAVFFELVGTRILLSFFEENSFWMVIAMFILVVGPVEEGLKYFFLKKRSWKHKAFDSMFDGIIYALVVSMGFALFENIGYVQQMGLYAAFIRALTAIPAHATFSVFMGIWYAYAKQCENRGDIKGMKSNLTKAFLIPACIHGIYDTIPSLNIPGSEFIFIVFILFLFRKAYNLVKETAQNDIPL